MVAPALPPEIAQLVLDQKARAVHKVFGGNPRAGVPYFYGWILRFDGHTTPDERRLLRAHGFQFSGGKWCRRDAGSPVVSDEQNAARDRVLDYLGEAANVTPEEERALLAEWNTDDKGKST